MRSHSVRFGLSLLLLLAVVAGCGKALPRFDRMNRVQSAAFTDARALAPDPRRPALPPVNITDPDRLIALERWIDARKGRWEKSAETPRPTRFQLELRGDGGPIHTLWLDRGYAQMVNGKTLREMRLTNADTQELFSILGVPSDAMDGPPEPDYGPPRSGIVPGPHGGGK